MNASISVVLYKSKTLANGENPLLVQVSKDGKCKYKSLGLSVNQKLWDFKRSKLKPNCPDGDYIQQWAGTCRLVSCGSNHTRVFVYCIA